MAMSIDKSNEGVRAVDRALDILMAFRAGDRQLSAGELLKRVDLSRPTLYRLLRTLELQRFHRVVGDPQRFELGPSVAHLAHVWSSSLDIATLSQPMLRRLWDQTGETVALLVHHGNSESVWPNCRARSRSASNAAWAIRRRRDRWARAGVPSLPMFPHPKAI
jgi:DNA-binding IclR family transcriptional regulator